MFEKFFVPKLDANNNHFELFFNLIWMLGPLCVIQVFDLLIVLSSLLALTPWVDFPTEVTTIIYLWNREAPSSHEFIWYDSRLLTYGFQIARAMRIFRVFGTVKVLRFVKKLFDLFCNTYGALVCISQSLKRIIDPLVTSFFPVTNAFVVLAVVMGFCKFLEDLKN